MGSEMCIRDRLECKLLEAKVLSGETKLGDKVVNIVAPALTVEGQEA